jgi:hypothetical protein
LLIPDPIHKFGAERPECDAILCYVDHSNNHDPDSNVIKERNSHFTNEYLPNTSTDIGRTNSTKLLSLNANPSIRDNLDPDSDVIEKTDLHSEEYHAPQTSAETGRIISTKLNSRNAHLSVRNNFDLN